MMITKLFYFDLSGKKFCQNILRSKNFMLKLRHQVLEAEAMQKLLFMYNWLEQCHFCRHKNAWKIFTT